MKKICLVFLFFIPQVIFAQELPIVINQIMIGQAEGAKNEFIELYNPNTTEVSLEGYSLKKKTASGSESNLISAKKFSGTIPALGNFLISSPEFFEQVRADLNYSTSNSLANNNSLLFYDSSGILIDKIGWGSGSDFWVTPLENPPNNSIVKRITINNSHPNNYNDFKIVETGGEIKNSKNEKITIKNHPKTVGEAQSGGGGNKKQTISARISDMYRLPNKSLVVVSGLVANLPGELASQYFYIIGADEKTENFIPGWQIYNYYKEFPQLKIGDEVVIQGELSLGESVWRLKTKTAEDITIKSSDNLWEDIKTTPIATLSTIPNYSLVKVRGKILQNKTNAIFLDDGSGEVLISIKKGTEINPKSLEEGSLFAISGILNLGKDKIEILPLSDKFIISNDSAPKEESPGEIIADNPLIIASRQKEKQKLITKYFLTSVALVSICFFLSNKIKLN